MGLDQYITKKVVKNEEVAYWRKFGELQNLMHMIYERETGNTDDFNCKELVLTPEICDEVIEAIQNRHLPDHNGFFFGSPNTEGNEYLDMAVERFEFVKQQILGDPESEYVYHAWY